MSNNSLQLEKIITKGVLIVSQKITVTLNEDLIARVQAVADEYGIGRSGAVSVLLTEAIKNRDTLVSFNDAVKKMKTVEPEQLELK